ncbi:hypothetical protein [Dyella amyloliquefaciens]|uniref:hypothetical protein n=1 Tax=Dyella amyloliquefaciens TaxID=1770545 RepID=UPI00102E8FB5|nr:hypothetical protein [Dyella amyloliquefaciens]
MKKTLEVPLLGHGSETLEPGEDRGTPPMMAPWHLMKVAKQGHLQVRLGSKADLINLFKQIPDTHQQQRYCAGQHCHECPE